MWIVALAACSLPSPTRPADLVVVADRVIEIADGRIRAIHEPSSEAPVAIGPETRVRRADRVTAGFVDAHAHPDGLGRKLAALDLGGADSYAEALEAVRQARPTGGWLVGSGWDQERWPDAPEGGWPLAADLENLHPHVSVRLERIDGHAAWVSLTALQAVGVTAATPDPAGGRVVRDASGNPTGVLVDRAMALVPPPTASREVEVRQMQAALVLIAAKGLTGVHAMGVSDRALGILAQIAAADQLPVRIWAYVEPEGEAAERLLASGPWGEGRLKVVGIKAFADGGLGSRGALLAEPYADAPDQRGTELTAPAELERLARAAREAGVGLAVHAIGDLAVHRALDAFAAAPPAREGALPLRIEHAQVVRPDDRARFASLGVVASMQPTHAVSDATWADERLGPDRLPWAYAWRSLLDAGAPLAFGSDFPVEAVDPGLGLAAAVTRDGFTVAEAVSLDEAIAAFTAGAAWAVGETGLGTLEVGQAADLTLWGIDGERWRAIGTVVGGEIVAEAPAARQ
jgi:predicted amidohydrolase YtcJ